MGKDSHYSSGEKGIAYSDNQGPTLQPFSPYLPVSSACAGNEEDAIEK